MDKDAENEKENQEMRMTDCDNHSVNDECMSSAEDDETDIDVSKDGEDEEDDLHENSSTEGEDAGENEEDTLDAKSPEGDRCPICLNCLSLGQDIGTPDSCEGVHHFCLDCIEEWSANVNTCPVDRKEFHVILVQRELLGSIIERLSHENNVVHHEDLTYCEICGRCDHEDTLLLCDNCDFGYHCHCLNPPLDRVPIEEWYCPDCSESMFGTSDFNSTLQELNRLRRARGSRAIARTGASELVRSRIERRRLHPEDNLTDTIDSVASGSGDIPERRNPSRPARRSCSRRRTVRRTSSKKRASSTRRKVTRRTKGKKRKTKRCKSRRARASNRALPAPSAARSRIIERLGLERKKAHGPHSMPTMRRPVEHDLELDRTSAGVGSLSMFGRNMASHGSVPVMDVYEDDVEQGGELSIMRPSRHCIRDINLNTKANHMHRLPAIVQSTRVDLLDSILAGQKILMTPSRHVTITKDGTLQLNAPSVKRSPEKKISNIRLSISGPPPTRAPVPLPVTSPAHQDLFLVKPEPGISLSNTQNDVPQRIETNVYSDVEEPVEADEMSTDDGSLKEVVPPVDGQNDQSPKSDNSNDDNLVIDDTDKKESTVHSDHTESLADSVPVVAKEVTSNGHNSQEPDKSLSIETKEPTTEASSKPESQKDKKSPPKISPKPHIPLSCLQVNKRRMEIKINFNKDNRQSPAKLSLETDLEMKVEKDAEAQNGGDLVSSEAVAISDETAPLPVEAEKVKDGESDKIESDSGKRHKKLCKHGKPMKKKDKKPETDEIEKVPADLDSSVCTQSLEVVQSEAAVPDVIKSELSEVSVLSVVESQQPEELVVKAEDPNVSVSESFKKVSSSSKSRVYRDGKPRDEDKISKERERERKKSTDSKNSVDAEKSRKDKDSSSKDKKSDKTKVKHEIEGARDSKSSKPAKHKHHHKHHHKDQDKERARDRSEVVVHSRDNQGKGDVKRDRSGSKRKSVDEHDGDRNHKKTKVDDKILQIKRDRRPEKPDSERDRPLSLGSKTKTTTGSRSRDTRRSPVRDVKRSSFRLKADFDMFADETKGKPADKTKATGPRTPPETKSSHSAALSSPDLPTPTLDESAEVDSVHNNDSSSIKSPFLPGSLSPTSSDIYDPAAPIDDSPMEKLPSPPRKPSSSKPSSSAQNSQSMSSLLTNLIKAMNSNHSTQTPAAPNTLLAQIQETLSRQQRDKNDVMQKQLMEQLVTLLSANSSKTNTGQSSEKLSSLQRAAELVQHGKLNLPGIDASYRQAGDKNDKQEKMSDKTPKKSTASKSESSNQRKSDTNEDMAGSAVEMNRRDKYVEKLHRQERAIEEVKQALKPFYGKKEITKDEYKEIMRKAVPKICHSKNGVINLDKVRSLIEVYVKKFKHQRKKEKKLSSGKADPSHSPKPGTSSATT